MKITNALLTLLLVSPVFNKSDLELYKEKHPDISLDKPLLERRANPYCDGDGPID
jgi:hypothetical protein